MKSPTNATVGTAAKNVESSSEAKRYVIVPVATDDAGGTAATSSATSQKSREDEQPSVLARLRKIGATFRSKQTMTALSYEKYQQRFHHHSSSSAQDGVGKPIQQDEGRQDSTFRSDMSALTREVEESFFVGEKTAFSLITKPARTSKPDTNHHEKERDYWKAIVLKRTVLHGMTHLRTAEAIMNLGNAQLCCDENREAGKTFLSAVKIFQSIYGDNHLSVASALNKLGLAASKTRQNLDLALAALEDSLRIRVGELGLEHVDSVDTLNNIAGVRLNQGQYEMSARNYYSVYLFRTRIFGQDHPSVAVTATILAGILGRNPSSEARSREFYLVALRIYKSLGMERSTEGKKIRRCLAALRKPKGTTSTTTTIRVGPHQEPPSGVKGKNLSMISGCSKVKSNCNKKYQSKSRSYNRSSQTMLKFPNELSSPSKHSNQITRAQSSEMFHERLEL